MSINSSKYFPILINLSGYFVLVVGGGIVAERKIGNLLEFNADVTVISPEFTASIEEMIEEKKIKALWKKYEQGDEENYKIIFCATGDRSISKILKEKCLEKNILLNVADVPDLCSFIMPSTIKRGDFTLSVATQGKAPFFTKFIRDKYEKSLSPYFENIVELAEIFRSLVLNSGKFDNQAVKINLFEQFLEIEWEEIILKHGMDECRNIINEIIKSEECK